MSSGHIHTRTACIHSMAKSRLPLQPNDEWHKWYMIYWSWEGCLLCIMHIVQDAQSMQTNSWDLFSTYPNSCQTIRAVYVSHLTLSLAQTHVFKNQNKVKEIFEACAVRLRASERVNKSLSAFLLEVVTMKAVHSDSHCLFHAVISVQPLQSDMQFCSLTKMQNQQRTEK